MRIHEIKPIIEGEGKYVGTPEVMIRCQGCSMNCKTCDSPETQSFNNGSIMSVNEVIEEVEKYKQKNITISGGNPLEQNIDELIDLIKTLKKNDYHVNIEATGCDVLSKKHIENLLNTVDFISFDVKTPSSGNDKNFHSSSVTWQFKAQYKMVISNWGDYKFAKKIMNKYRSIDNSKFILTPSWEQGKNLDKEFVQKLYQQIIKDGLKCRLIPQIHKIIYNSEAKGV